MTTNNITGDRIASKIGPAEQQRKFEEGFDRIFPSHTCSDCGKSIASGHIHTCSPQVKEKP